MPLSFEALLGKLTFFEDQLPIIATNIIKGNIERTFLEYLHDPRLDTVYFTAPYVSDYFVSIMKTTPVKALFGIINKDPPSYTKDAVEDFFKLAIDRNIDVNIVKRPDKSAFIHMKVLIPIYWIKPHGFIAACAIIGSSNFTLGGFKRNDEMIAVIRDRQGIINCLKTIYDKGIESQNME